jgi:ABC-type polysaccharide/polyol phosphate transport system ATPase subunit
LANAIEIEGLSKRYRLGVDPAGYDTLREAIKRRISPRRDADEAEVWALRDLSLTVGEGEALGIVGPNGAGKTTLLKILSGITEPTSGEARTRGQVGPLLEVGTGVHPELTGRENIYLSAAILGMRRAEVRRRFDEIVEFAGLEAFLDTPVKRYSMGMRLRLAFAVAAEIEPPIIVVDEVLAVGDAEFQEKCLGRMADFGRHSRTVLFVSHDLGAITRLCSRAVWLDEGRVREDGPAAEVVSAYLESTPEQPLEATFTEPEGGPVALTAAGIRDPSGSALSSPRRDQPFVVEVGFTARTRIPGLTVWIGLLDEKGVTVLLDAHNDRVHTGAEVREPGEYRIAVTIPPLLAPGTYVVKTWIGTPHEEYV